MTANIPKNLRQTGGDCMSYKWAIESVRLLRQQYKAFPHFRAEVFISENSHSQHPLYVVRTNMVDGSPPLYPTEIFTKSARPIPKQQEIAA